MKAAMLRHDELVEKTIDANQGFVFARMGDGMAAAFATASDAVSAAAAIRRLLADESWLTPKPLRARIGLHTDEAVIVNDNNYASQPVNRCSRLMSAAHGGQVVISGITKELVREDLPDGMALIDLGEHRLRDLGSPMRVFELIRDGQREDFPPLRSMDSFPGNVPAQVSSFIGRQAEVARVESALGQSRVVTITGVGGVGKTRLSLQVAADLLPRYREGAWLVELDPVRDPAGVVEAVAAVFQLTGRTGHSLEDSLIEMLAEKQLLLVLDNCEHLLGSVADLVSRLERACPGVVVLATSREGIAIDGEQLIALPPLESGDPGEDIERLVNTDAVCLFVERARNVKADFTLTSSNARAVVEVCQRLDGVPLAIELAAARVIALTPAELARRLDRRFQVLARGRRDAIARHATLRAAIDWSYELLGEAEQRLLARMAVFSGGSSLEAIEEVCSAKPVQREEVLDVVTGLVARSLVVAEDRGLGTCYRLLESIRQYGEERLAEWGEAETLLLGHAHFYAGLLAQAAERACGPEQLVWARTLNLERDNIRAALANAIDAGDAALAVELVADYPHRHNQTSNVMGDALLVPAARVLDLDGAAQQPQFPRVVIVAAYEASVTGDYQTVEQLCLRALDAEQNLPPPQRDPRVEMDVCALRALRFLSTGAYADAVGAYTRAGELACAAGYSGLSAIYLSHSVSTALLGGADTGDVSARAEESLAMARKSGMPAAIVVSLNALALAVAERDPERAQALLRESVERSSTPYGEISISLVTAGLAAIRLRDWDLALALTARTMQLWRWNLVDVFAATCLAQCARAFAEGRPEVAGVLQGAAYAAFRRASLAAEKRRPSTSAPAGPNANFLLEALRETGELVAAALSDERRREVRAEGAAMSMDEAISFALANIGTSGIGGSGA